MAVHCRSVHLTVMRVKTVEGDEHTGVYLPHQIAPGVLEALRQAEPELAGVKMAGGESRIPSPLHLLYYICMT